MANVAHFFNRAAALAALLAFGSVAFAQVQDPQVRPKQRAEADVVDADASRNRDAAEYRMLVGDEPIKDDPEGRAEWFREWFGPIAPGYLAHRQAVAEREIERWGALIPGTAAHKSARANRANAGPNSGIPESVWRSIGPFSGENNYSYSSTQIDTGRVTVILSHPTIPNLLYVGYAGGGLWRCQNADPAIDGDWNWECLTDGLPTGTAAGNVSIGSAAFKPGDPSTIYLSMGDMMPGSAMAGDDGGTAQGRGFYISSDGGDTWTAGGGLGNTTRTKTVLALPGNIVLVAGNSGLWRSTNGGTTFTQVSGVTTGSVWDILRLDGGDLVVSFNGGTAYSTDNGATWTNSTRSGLPAGSVYRVAIAANGSMLYALFQMGGDSFPKGLMKSNDGGRTWFYQAASTLFSFSSGDGGQSGYNQMIAVDPEDPNTVFVGANLCLYRSTDGGLTFQAMSHWASQNRHYIHADLHVAAWSAFGPKALYIGTDGGMSIVRKPNISPIPTNPSAGVDHTYIDNRRNKNIAAHLIYNLACTIADEPAGSRQRVLIGLQDNGTRLRRESGVAAGAYNEVIGGDGFGCLIHAKNGNLMLGSLYFTSIRRSANGGNSFGNSNTGITGSGPFYTRLFDTAADPDGNRVYTFTTSTLYSSDNFGSSWTALPRSGNGWPGGTIRSFGASPLKLDMIGATLSNRVAISYDNGASWWSYQGFPGHGGSTGELTFDSADENIIYVTSVSFSQTANHLWKTMDGGSTWAAIDGTASNSNGFPFGVPVHVLRVDPLDNNVIYAGTDVGLYRSEDQGATWARFGSDLPLMSVRDIYVAPDGSFIRLGTHGRGVWEMATPVTVALGPKAVALAPGATQRFSATVIGGNGNHSVTWSAAVGSITQDGIYTAPLAVGATDTVTATSQEDPTKFDTASVMVARLTVTGSARGLFTRGTAKFGVSVEGVSDEVAWNATDGSITREGLFTAPDTPQMVTITAISLQAPLISGSVQVKVSSPDFDLNKKMDPQLLGLAAAFGSTAAPDLDKYDFDGDGAVGNGDLTMLFAEMEW